jgi:hypothetical protein
MPGSVVLTSVSGSVLVTGSDVPASDVLVVAPAGWVSDATTGTGDAGTWEIGGPTGAGELAVPAPGPLG